VSTTSVSAKHAGGARVSPGLPHAGDPLVNDAKICTHPCGRRRAVVLDGQAHLLDRTELRFDDLGLRNPF